MYLHAVPRIWTGLLAADVELHGAIDRGRVRLRRILFLFWNWDSGRGQLWRLFKPFRFHVLEQAFASALPAVAALAVPAEPARGIEQVRAVHPADSGFVLCRDVASDV